MTLKEVGITHALRRGMDDEKTLAMLRFSTVKVLPWQRPGSAPVPPQGAPDRETRKDRGKGRLSRGRP